MGYLDNTTVTVDAILTNKGRQVLSLGGQLNITKFALADDEVDYDLWNPAHSLGTNYYGSVIENMPVLEASSDETQMLRYKLVTLPKNAIGIPVIQLQPSGPVSFTRMSTPITITVSTPNYSNGNSILGYTAILSDDTVASLEVATNSMLPQTTINTNPMIENEDGVDGRALVNRAAPARALVNRGTNTQGIFSSFMNDEVGSITTTGNTITRTSTKSFTLSPKQVIGTKSALLTIVANETGGFQTIVITSTNTIDQNSVDVGTGSEQ